jgi:hypothetical protein
MPRYRTVGSEEIDRSSAIADPDTTRAYRAYLQSSWEAGETSPDRWFVAEEDGEIVGRIVFWSLPGSEHVSLDVFALPWADPRRRPLAAQLLQTGLDDLRRRGVQSVVYERHEPDPDGHTPPALIETLEAAGFSEVRRTVRVELRPVPVLEPSGRVSYAGLGDGIRIEDFSEVVGRCAASGLDTGVTHRDRDASTGEAARAFVEATMSMRGGSTLWRIAHVGSDVVGVILPTANDGGPVLNYVGVVPERRGERLVDDLLLETARLHGAHGAERIRADCDEQNEPMQAAFARAGWSEFGRRTDYRLEL